MIILIFSDTPKKVARELLQSLGLSEDYLESIGQFIKKRVNGYLMKVRKKRVRLSRSTSDAPLRRSPFKKEENQKEKDRFSIPEHLLEKNLKSFLTSQPSRRWADPQ